MVNQIDSAARALPDKATEPSKPLAATTASLLPPLLEKLENVILVRLTLISAAGAILAHARIVIRQMQIVVICPVSAVDAMATAETVRAHPRLSKVSYQSDCWTSAAAHDQSQNERKEPLDHEAEGQ